MTERYPEIEPFAHGMLDVGEGQSLYWEMCGNPKGKPALVLHGGPGSGCTASVRRLFDPAAYRIILFDQRQCGRSTPHASDPNTDLSVNTTNHLLRDIEALRRHLGVERWLLFGSSWGATLALAYAEQHPAQVSEIVLSHVTMSRPADIRWLYHGVGRHFPESWSCFWAGAGVDDPNADLVEAYAKLLSSPDRTVCERAAKDWCAWEDAVVSIDPRHPPNPRYRDPKFRMAFARIVTHYFRHNCWLEEGALLRNIGAIAGIPAVLIHGRLDLASPLAVAQELAQAWPAAELVVVDDAGHEMLTAGITQSVVAATDRFRG